MRLYRNCKSQLFILGYFWSARECSRDLAAFLDHNRPATKGNTAIELGCGHGLPGVMALTVLRYNLVVFSDFNENV